MDYELILKIINKAVCETIQNDNYLFKSNVHECAVSFRLGYYIQKLLCDTNKLQDVIVDAEYNRNGYDVKKAYSTCKKCKIHCQNNDFIAEDTFIRPDLILHKRSEHSNIWENNYIVIEVKKSSNELENDFNKLKYLTCSLAEYQYKIGISVNFFIENGKIIPSETYFYDSECIDYVNLLSQLN